MRGRITTEKAGSLEHQCQRQRATGKPMWDSLPSVGFRRCDKCDALGYCRRHRRKNYCKACHNRAKK